MCIKEDGNAHSFTHSFIHWTPPHLDGEEQFELCWQLIFTIQTIREINTTDPTVGMNLQHTKQRVRARKEGAEENTGQAVCIVSPSRG